MTQGREGDSGTAESRQPIKQNARFITLSSPNHQRYFRQNANGLSFPLPTPGEAPFRKLITIMAKPLPVSPGPRLLGVEQNTVIVTPGDGTEAVRSAVEVAVVLAWPLGRQALEPLVFPTLRAVESQSEEAQPSQIRAEEDLSLTGLLVHFIDSLR
ncbi:hypothetical protein ANANG_G00048740 [Anguilla anguilla]|uniref:Uncharacterized protein n=1 Tax=Anguilla anguilla TaxID=7936 RepID=A0A9D3MV54_ANGAN|nr:hypothetical protein ANANG_G00048740 [Anguilla anguilla]